MRNLLNPKWIFIINILPVIVLFFLLSSQLNIIKTLLEEDSLRLWRNFGITLGILTLCNLIYAIFLIVKKQNISVWYAVLALTVYIPFIYLYAYHLDKIIPSSVPQWMVSDNIFLYVGTFLMPTIAFSLFILVAYFTPENKRKNAGYDFLIAIGIPVIGYIFSQIVLPLWQRVDGEFHIHSILILIITATLLFLFFLIRGIFILITNKSSSLKKYQLAWKIPIAIILPLIGLAVNNGLLFNSFRISDSGVFGDFNDYWFYILALLNGILICLPECKNKNYRLFLFFGRCITFAFTFYFFLVFLPFLPLSIIAIIAIGTGFLMLTPLLLFVIHLNEIITDFNYLKPLFSKKIITGISVLGFLVLPLSITFSYLNDKKVLHEALDYLYSPDYSKDYAINTSSLQKTLNIVSNHKDNRGGGIFGTQQPYLSSYFNWLVLDNLTLSDSKIAKIKSVFFDENTFGFYSENNRNSNVNITDISSKSVYNSSQKAWKSWIDLEITNPNNRAFSEYVTTIDLPEGCWISDYYLFVGDVQEFGILAEKKSAMWVFSQIRSENKDPGLLHYLSGNKVSFRVFPFSENEVRKTGIEFLHKEPVKITIDGNVVELGNEKETIYENTETENFVYVSSQQKEQLKSVKRKPYFHFLVDVSQRKKDSVATFTNRIETIINEKPELSENAQISFVNSYSNTISLEKNWKETYKSQHFEGGFYLERAIENVLFNAYKAQKESYPVIVVVTDNMYTSVLEKNFSDFEFAFPESNLFYHLDKNSTLKEHSLIGNPLEALPEILRECMFCETVLEYKLSDNSVVYLSDTNKPSIILKKDKFDISDSDIKEKNWLSGLALQAKWNSQILHPETSDKEWLNLVKHSFYSKIMTPLTSYIVVENEAQKAILKKKQEQVLSGKKSLDIGEDTQRMSEPSWLVVILLLTLFLWYQNKRKSLKNHKL